MPPPCCRQGESTIERQYANYRTDASCTLSACPIRCACGVIGLGLWRLGLVSDQQLLTSPAPSLQYPSATASPQTLSSRLPPPPLPAHPPPNRPSPSRPAPARRW